MPKARVKVHAVPISTEVMAETTAEAFARDGKCRDYEAEAEAVYQALFLGRFQFKLDHLAAIVRAMKGRG